MLKSFSVSAGNFLRSFSVKASSVVTLALLSGCLVHSNGGKTFFRETDSIHLYQPGDFIEYSVSGTYASTMTSFHSVSGTLRIDWSVPDPIYDPITGNQVTGLLKEVSTLNVGGNETHIVRYISQDIDGNIYLHAFDKDGTYYFWVNNSSGTPPSSLNKVQLWQSPLAITPSNYDIKFYVFDDCDNTNLCKTYLGSQTETGKVESDNVDIQTDPGVFNTFRVSVNGNDQPGSGVTSFLPINFLDTRSSCSSNGAYFNGQAYVFPQVGVVAMNMHCNASSGYPSFDYTFSFKHAGGSIALPSPS